jgi:hypothetical protein
MASRGDLDGPTNPQGHNLEGHTLTIDGRLVNVVLSWPCPDGSSAALMNQTVSVGRYIPFADREVREVKRKSRILNIHWIDRRRENRLFAELDRLGGLMVWLSRKKKRKRVRSMTSEAIALFEPRGNGLRCPPRASFAFFRFFFPFSFSFFTPLRVPPSINNWIQSDKVGFFFFFWTLAPSH